MRTLTEMQRAILEGAAYAVHARVLIEDADGNLANIDDAEGGGWFIGARWSEDIDHPVADATIELRRDAGDALSLSPLRTDSPVNRDSAGAYAPRVEMGRQVVIQAAATAPEELPSEAGYVTLFHGVIDRVAAASDPLVLTCRDLGGVLVDRQIETEITYGAPEGVPLETVMQQVLDDHAPGIVLNVPASPGFMVTEYTPSDVSVMEALQTLAGTIGWDVRYRWNEAAGEFQLTLQEPDREKVDPDHTIGPDLYADLRALELDSEDVRNVIDVVYPDAATGEIETVRVEDAASIARYGRRYMRIEEGSDSPIDTAAEALALADAALSDLKDPLASHEIGMLFWPAVELGDVYRYLANGVHYDIDQTFAVVAYRHELRPDRQRTTITARGRPAGAYLRWLVRGTHGVGDVVYLECRARIITSDATSVTVQVDAVSPDGRVPQVALVELAAAEVTAGADLGVQVDAGAQWTFARPPFRAGEGMARFRAAAAGYQSDDDAVVIPEVGRDTVQLTMRVRPLSQTATTAAFRVSIGDPEYAELAGAVSVSWDDAGSTGGITPASPQTIPAAAIRATPAETEAAGGYVDITITKPAAGAGPGRVVLEATRPGRVRDIDAVDVAEIPPEGAITALPPTARIEYVLEDAVFVRLRHTGTLGEGGTGPLEYRRRVRDGSTPGPWGPGAGDGWATLPAGGATQDIPKPARDPAIVELEVRDALGLVGHDTYEIAATLGGINRETGNATWSSVEDDDPTRPRPADGATVGAPTGTIVGATLAETVEDGSLRAQIAIVPDGRALSEGTGIIDGLGVSTIYRHREEVSVGADPDGISNVDFGQPYQSAPAIALRGHQCVTYSQDLADLGATRQKLRIQAASVTPSGFVSIAEIVSTGTVTQQDDDFPSGNVLDAVGETAAATLNPGGANDHRYLVQYYVEILAAPPIGGGEVNRPTLFVAIDTDDGSGFEERAVFQYQGFADQAGFNTETWPQEVRPVIVLGLASGDQIRLRIKSWNPDKGGSFVVRGGDGSGSNAESYHGVTYTTATDETRSAIPDAGDFVEWLAQEVV